MEQRESGVEMKASSLVSEFDQKFRRIEFTLHPSDIPGESPGKGSNVAWAARKLSEKYPMATRRDVIITSIDGACTGTISRRLCCCMIVEVEQNIVETNIVWLCSRQSLVL